MDITELIPIIRVSTMFEENRKQEEIFNHGYSAGYEEGFDAGIEMKFCLCGSVSEQTYNQLMEFLTNNGIEMVYSRNSGLVVRRRNYTPDDLENFKGFYKRKTFDVR